MQLPNTLYESSIFEAVVLLAFNKSSFMQCVMLVTVALV
jgi:hypothetical protein